MIKAAIDIGSNSIRLGVSEVGEGVYRPLLTKRNSTRIHLGLSADGFLSEDTLCKNTDAICAFFDEARLLGAEKILAFATSAVRDAKNGSELVRRVREKRGLAIRILSGEEEAALAYRAAAGDGCCGVIDIGGASTEIICGHDGIVDKSVSLQLGALRLRRQLPEDPTVADRKAAAAAILAPALVTLSPLPQTFRGVAGTITTLCMVRHALLSFSEKAAEGLSLTREEVASLLEAFAGMTVQERLRVPGMSPHHAEHIDCGAAILLTFMELAEVPCLTLSVRDNLYSVMTDESY